MDGMKKKLWMPALLIMPLLIVIPVVNSDVFWSSETRLTTHLSWDVGSSITETLDGRIWIVWQREDAGNWDLSYNTYNGSAWSGDMKLTTDLAHDTAPSIFQSPSGTIWVFWASDRTGNYDIFYKTSSNGGLSWLNDTPITYDPSDDVNPTFIEASDGTLWVVWARKAASGYYDIFYKTSSNGGISWSSEIRLTTDPNHDKLPSIAQMWDGRIWVAWSSNRVGNDEVFYKTYDGSAWSNDTRLTYSDQLNSDPSIVQARDGSILIVWSSRAPKDIPSTNDNLFYKVSTDNGVTWSSSVQLTLDPDWDEVWPSIAQSSDGRLWATYTSDKNNNYDIYYMTSNVIIIHDVTVTGVTVSPVLVYRDDNVYVNVTALNQGEAQETFNVTCYANSTAIGTQTVTLAAGASTVLTFVWTTTGFNRGNYVLSARAIAPPAETVPCQVNNSFTDGVVRVKITGDVDDSGMVNIIDLATIGVSFGKGVGEPLYNVDADINHDSLVDISDLAIAGRNYGKKS